ncbi:MAG TPA: hypothetical protein VF310_13730 [Vicinamibacteria bacterium]
MTRRGTRRALLLLLLAAGARAQEAPPPRQGDEVEWYVVKAGETLEQITARHLGNPRLWKENWRLNPAVPDPHKLTPGQRLRIIVRRHSRTAEVSVISRRVEQQAAPRPWTAAQVGDLLSQGDGVRTYEQSSAELRFDDGARLAISESSLIFLRDARERPREPPRRSLEIRAGQADLETRATALPSRLEIRVGAARAQPRSAAATRARARTGPEGSAQFMVFGGATEVSAAGRQVTVAEGQGTAGPAGQPPRPPEQLLPAPALREPAAGAALDFANPTFSWETVAGAAGYTIEVFRDAEGRELVDRAAGLAGARWQAGGLPMADLHWRVTAVSASGLDGFPSELRPLSIRSYWRRPER